MSQLERKRARTGATLRLLLGLCLPASAASAADWVTRLDTLAPSLTDPVLVADHPRGDALFSIRTLAPTGRLGIRLHRLDPAGGFVAASELGSVERHLRAEDLALSPDGSLLVAGLADGLPFALKLTRTDQVLWSRSLSTNDPFTPGLRLLAAPDGGCLILHGDDELQRLDDRGRLLWQRRLVGADLAEPDSRSRITAMAFDATGLLHVAGSAGSTDRDLGWAWLLRVDEQGEVVSGTELTLLDCPDQADSMHPAGVTGLDDGRSLVWGQGGCDGDDADPWILALDAGAGVERALRLPLGACDFERARLSDSDSLYLPCREEPSDGSPSRVVVTELAVADLSVLAVTGLPLAPGTTYGGASADGGFLRIAMNRFGRAWLSRSERGQAGPCLPLDELPLSVGTDLEVLASPPRFDGSFGPLDPDPWTIERFGASVTTAQDCDAGPPADPLLWAARRGGVPGELVLEWSEDQTALWTRVLEGDLEALRATGSIAAATLATDCPAGGPAPWSTQLEPGTSDRFYLVRPGNLHGQAEPRRDSLDRPRDWPPLACP